MKEMSKNISALEYNNVRTGRKNHFKTIKLILNTHGFFFF